MKKLYSLLFLLVFIFAGCEQEEFSGTGLEALEDFQLVTGNETVELRSIYPENELTIEWSEAASGLDSEVLYTWVAYDENSSTENPLVAIPSNNEGKENALTVTFQALDSTLEELGIGEGETITLNWTVTADNGDVIKVATPNTITLTRFKDEIAPFGLGTPNNETSIDLDIDQPETNIVIEWDSTYSGFGSEISYNFIADERGGDFRNPVLDLVSDGEGALPRLTVTNGQLDEILAGLGLEQGEVIELDWKVVATTPSGVIQESESDFNIDLRRFDVKVDFTLVLNRANTDIPEGFDVFVAGQFDKLGIAEAEWQQPGTNPNLQMEYNEELSRYELNLRVAPNLVGTTFEYKYFLATTTAPNWDNGEQRYGANGCEGVSNRSITFIAAGQVVDDEVMVWQGFCESNAPMRVLLNVNENFPANQGLDVYVAGNFGFVEWPQPGTDDRLKMNKINDTQYEIFLPVPEGHNGVFKYFLATKTNPNWGNGEQLVNETNAGCNGAPDRSFSFTGTESIEGTVNVWEGFCPF